jgi:hypothetical protein
MLHQGFSKAPKAWLPKASIVQAGSKAIRLKPNLPPLLPGESVATVS